MYTSIQDIKKANENAGFYYFSPDTMKWFKTKICGDVLGGHFFVIRNTQTFHLTNRPSQNVFKLAFCTERGSIMHLTKDLKTAKYARSFYKDAPYKENFAAFFNKWDTYRNNIPEREKFWRDAYTNEANPFHIVACYIAMNRRVFNFSGMSDIREEIESR